MNKVEWKKKAIKQLKKVHSSMQPVIVEEVGKLTDFSNASNVKSLTNHLYDYRLRVGNYRVFFNHAETVEIVTIEEVKKRDERTY